MALKVKAVEKLLKFSNDPNDKGEYRYVLSPDLYTALNQEKVIKEAAQRSGVMEGVMKACWDAAGQVIKAWATEGHSVAIPGLGTMRFGHPPHHLHPIGGPEGRAEEHRHPDYLYRPQR